MDFAFLWIFCLSALLSIAAFFFSIAGRFKRKLCQYLVAYLPTGLIFLLLCVETILLGFLRMDNIRPLWMFPYALFLTMGYLIGILLIFRRGMRKTNETRSSHKWPRVRLAFSAGLFICLTVASYLYIDLKVLIEFSQNKAESAVMAQNQLPPRLPEAQNAAFLYERAGVMGIRPAGGVSNKVKISREKKPKWFSTLTPAAFKPLSREAYELIERYDRPLAMIRRASALSGFYFETNTADLFNSSIPNYIKFRDFSRLLVLSAQQKVLNDDTAGAFNELNVIRRMTAHVRGTPTLIAAMVAGVMDQLYISGLEYVLAHAETIPGAVIEERTAYFREMPSFFYRSFQMESLIGLQILSSLDQDVDVDLVFGSYFDFSTILLKIMGIRFWRVFFARDEMASHRQFWDGFLERIGTPAEKNIGSLKKWMAEWEAGPRGLLTSRFLPDFSYYAIRAQQYLAMQRLGALALAAEAFRKDTGRYSNRIEELVPAYLETLPTDPFDGKPLRLEPLDNGLDLYSVGPDPEELEKNATLAGPIHFYLGREVYQKYRIQPILIEQNKQKKQKKKKK